MRKDGSVRQNIILISYPHKVSCIDRNSNIYFIHALQRRRKTAHIPQGMAQSKQVEGEEISERVEKEKGRSRA